MLSILVVILAVLFLFFMMLNSQQSLSMQNTNAKYCYLCEIETEEGELYYLEVYSNLDKFRHNDLLQYVDKRKENILFKTATGKTVMLNKPIIRSLSFEIINNTKESDN